MDDETLTFMQNAESPLAEALRIKYKVEKGEDIESIKSKTEGSPIKHIKQYQGEIQVNYSYDKVQEFNITGSRIRVMNGIMNFDAEEIIDDSEYDLIDRISCLMDLEADIIFEDIEWENFDQDSLEVNEVYSEDIIISNWTEIQEELEELEANGDN